MKVEGSCLFRSLSGELMGQVIHHGGRTQDGWKRKVEGSCLLRSLSDGLMGQLGDHGGCTQDD